MSSAIYLYVKTHNKTGLKYLGKTTKKDPHKYKGSGKYWLRHIKKYGYDVSTEILLKTDSPLEIEKYGMYYSNLFDVVEDNKWANLCPETGKGAGCIGHKNGMYGRTHSKEVKRRLATEARSRFKDKSYEQLYGIEKAIELRKLRSKQAKLRDSAGSKNSRFDKNEYKFINVETNQIFVGTRYSFYTEKNFSKSAVHRLIHCPNYVYKKWTLHET